MKRPDSYPNSVPGNANYPFGSTKNISGPGLFDGFPMDRGWMNDYIAFFQAMMIEGSVSPSGVEDTILVSDYFTAFDNVVEATIDFNATVASKLAKSQNLDDLLNKGDSRDNLGVDSSAEVDAKIAAAAAGAWVNMTLLNSWAATRSRYRLINGGKHLEIDLYELDATSATDNAMFVFPSGFQPANEFLYEYASGGGAGIILSVNRLAANTLSGPAGSATQSSFSIQVPMD